ncbi:MAG: hypothetical protein WD059_09295 [Balneolaceae bacterium]
MARGKVYTGIIVDDDSLKVARVNITGKKVTLLNIDKISLVEHLHKKEKATQEASAVFGNVEDSLDDEPIFGLGDDDNDTDDIEDIGLEDLEGGLDDLGIDDLDDDNDFGDFEDEDMTTESEVASSNELLLYNVLNSIDHDRVDLGLSLPAGDTNFQILKDVDFSETKKKDLEVIVADRLEALYGVSKGEDYFSYTVRTDGALLLASIDDESQLLTLIDKTKDLYSGKIFINDIIPDETALLGLIRSNYELDEESITGVIQFGEKKSRILFLKGDQLWIISPMIAEGVKSKKILNTIFSKILFQLDTGEVPNLDRLIICNNSLGQETVEFFEERFQDIDVSEFRFSEDFFDPNGINESSIPAFTTAIGAAWASSGFQKENFPNISFLPAYIKERQKIFKLQWHGFLLLLFILLTPIISNHFYTQNAAEIDRLTTEVNSLDSQIRSLEPIVQEYNRISNEFDQIQTKLILLSELNEGTLRWSSNLNQLNRGVEDVNSIWLTSMGSSGQNNQIEVQGYAIYRSRIPQLADVFDKATLQGVTTEVIREKDVFVFRYVVRDFFGDHSIYTPESVQGIQELVGE